MESRRLRKLLGLEHGQLRLSNWGVLIPPYKTKKFETKRASTEQCEFQAAPGPALCHFLVWGEFWQNIPQKAPKLYPAPKTVWLLLVVDELLNQNAEHSAKSTKNIHSVQNIPQIAIESGTVLHVLECCGIWL